MIALGVGPDVVAVAWLKETVAGPVVDWLLAEVTLAVRVTALFGGRGSGTGVRLVAELVRGSSNGLAPARPCPWWLLDEDDAVWQAAGRAIGGAVVGVAGVLLVSHV